MTTTRPLFTGFGTFCAEGTTGRGSASGRGNGVSTPVCVGFLAASISVTDAAVCATSPLAGDTAEGATEGVAVTVVDEATERIAETVAEGTVEEGPTVGSLSTERNAPSTSSLCGELRHASLAISR